VCRRQLARARSRVCCSCVHAFMHGRRTSPSSPTRRLPHEPWGCLHHTPLHQAHSSPTRAQLEVAHTAHELLRLRLLQVAVHHLRVFEACAHAWCASTAGCAHCNLPTSLRTPVHVHRLPISRPIESAGPHPPFPRASWARSGACAQSACGAGGSAARLQGACTGSDVDAGPTTATRVRTHLEALLHRGVAVVDELGGLHLAHGDLREGGVSILACERVVRRGPSPRSHPRTHTHTHAQGPTFSMPAIEEKVGGVLPLVEDAAAAVEGRACCCRPLHACCVHACECACGCERAWVCACQELQALVLLVPAPSADGASEAAAPRRG